MQSIEEMDTPEQTPRPRRRRRWPWIAGLAVLLGGVGAGGYAYASHYADLVVPGTHVAGTDVSGMSEADVVALVSAQADKATVTISGDASATANLSDLGIDVDAKATAAAAMARGHAIVDRFTALLDDEDIAVVSTTDAQVADSYAQSLIADDQARAVNATVVLTDSGDSFTYTESSTGLSLDAAEIVAAGETAARTLQPASVTVSFSEEPPAVSTEDAQKLAQDANDYVATNIIITDAAGQGHSPSANDKASWVTVTAQDNALPTVSIDSEKVGAWVQAQADAASSDPVTGVRNVNEQGAVVSVVTEARDGRSVNNAEAITTSIVEGMTGASPVSADFTFDTTPATWKERTIANGAENLAYQAAPGEKWIDVNLSRHLVTAYEGATVVHGPISMVDGAPNTKTVTGTYKVYLKYPLQTMRGEDYVTPDVPWVSYFTGSYALHGAYWRSSFGYSDSHGCVNLPVSEAKWFYEWNEIGTTVVSHY